MTSQFDHQLAEIRDAMAQGGGKRLGEALRRLAADTESLDAEESTAVVEQIAPMLAGLEGTFSKLALVAGTMVGRGASPMALAQVLPERAFMTMAGNLALEQMWDQATQGRPLPEFVPPVDRARVVEIEETLRAEARRLGRSESTIRQVAYAWFSLDDWLSPLITAMARSPEFRKAMAWREEIADGADRLKHRSARAHWVYGLCRVCDDEPLIALDPSSGRGFRLTMSGVGDNFQLHTLLADRLMRPGHGGLLEAEPPEPAWVQAATTGPAGPFDPAHAVKRRLRLFDGHGGYVYPEGRPADIEPLEGVRVLVVHPPNGSFGWSNGRSYANMAPTLTLDQELEADEAAHWLSLVAPARETDALARNSG